MRAVCWASRLRWLCCAEMAASAGGLPWEPKNWTRKYKAAKQLRKDLADGIIDHRSYKPALEQKKRLVYQSFPKARFSANMRNVVTDFEAVAPLGGDRINEWVENGKPPARVASNQGK